MATLETLIMDIFGDPITAISIETFDVGLQLLPAFPTLLISQSTNMYNIDAAIS